MHRRVLGLLVALAVLAVACGAPKSSGFSAIPFANLPNGLTATTTTTIQLTTSTLESVSTTTTFEAPTTTIPIEAATLYFVAGGQLVSTPRYMISPTQPQLVLQALADGPDPSTPGLRTAVPHGAVMKFSTYRGVATVNLNTDFFTSMVDAADERLAIAQIVLSLTTSVRGVANVRFTIGGDDEPVEVFLVGDRALYGTGVGSEYGYGRVERVLSAAEEEDEGAFLDEALCRGEADAGRAAGNHRGLPIQSGHDLHPSRVAPCLSGNGPVTLEMGRSMSGYECGSVHIRGAKSNRQGFNVRHRHAGPQSPPALAHISKHYGDHCCRPAYHD